MRARSLLLAFGAGVVLGRLAGSGEPADLRGRAALVTGGSRGLGLLLARELGRHGCRVAICARDEAELGRARADLTARGVEALALRCDVADADAVDRLVRDVTEAFGGIDILVNNASIIQVGPVRTMTREHFAAALAVNFWGTVHPTLAVLPQMLARRQGRIVNITSIGGKVSVPHLLPYGAAKFAAVGFSEGLAAELAREGITVTTIAPGLMRTGSYVNALFEGHRRREFAWFSLGATLPGVSMDAERAARQIVEALRRGDTERILSLPAQALARAHGLFPALTVRALALVNRLLPAADGAALGPRPGHEVQARIHSPLLHVATRLGRSAAHRFHQYAGEARRAS